jgi:hypothetical protein
VGARLEGHRLSLEDARSAPPLLAERAQGGGGQHVVRSMNHPVLTLVVTRSERTVSRPRRSFVFVSSFAVPIVAEVLSIAFIVMLLCSTIREARGAVQGPFVVIDVWDGHALERQHVDMGGGFHPVCTPVETRSARTVSRPSVSFFVACVVEAVGLRMPGSIAPAMPFAVLARIEPSRSARVTRLDDLGKSGPYESSNALDDSS